MKEIKLNGSKNLVTKVDDEDFDMLSGYNWYLTGSGSGYAFGYKKGTYQKKGEQKQISMHRLLLNAKKGDSVDHINGDRLDNQKSNLRIASHSFNMANRGKFKNNKQGAKGVSLHKGKYRVQLVVGGFETKEQAAEAYIKLHTFYYGKYSIFSKIAEVQS